jgi:hypothetical protein
MYTGISQTSMTLHVLSCILHFESVTVATMIWSFLHHRVTRVTPRMSQVEQELLTFPDHLCTFTPPENTVQM